MLSCLNQQQLQRWLVPLLLCFQRPIASFTIYFPISSSRSRFVHGSTCYKSNSRQQQQQQQQLFSSTSSPTTNVEGDNSSSDLIRNGTVTIVDEGKHHLVVMKPPSVICHHSGWAGTKSTKKGKKEDTQEPEIPMLQRVREAVGQRINLVHRLDRGASGCLLCTFSNDQDDSDGEHRTTAILQEAMSSNDTHKTYIALVRGEGILRGENLRDKGWFCVDRPIKNEKGVEHDATTYFRFVAGQDSGGMDEESGGAILDRPRASLVLARPVTGRWHQIRRHLNGLSHPILGDATHGNSKVNREWKQKWGLLEERTCLHLARMQLPASEPYFPNGIDASCPLAEDMLAMLEQHLPEVLKEAEPILEEEGITLRPKESYNALSWEIKIQ